MHQPAAVRCLLRAGQTVHVLTTLARCGVAGHPHYADLVAARAPLAVAEWALVPRACQGLGRALPVALQHSPEQGRQLVARLPRPEAERLRCFALALARLQRQLRTPLPVPLLAKILSLFDA